MRQILIVISFLLILAILKSVLGYHHLIHQIPDANNLVKTLSLFGIMTGIITTILFFVLSSFLTYTFAIIFMKHTELSYIKLIYNWFSIGFTPMLITTSVFLLFYDEIFINNTHENISIINTGIELFFFTYGIFVLTKRTKMNYFLSFFCVALPLLIYYYFNLIL